MDIRERYHSNRTWRRTSDTRTIEQGVDGKDIDVVNRWSDTEQSRRGKLNQPMKQHYVQTELLIAPFKGIPGWCKSVIVIWMSDHNSG